MEISGAAQLHVESLEGENPEQEKIVAGHNKKQEDLKRKHEDSDFKSQEDRLVLELALSAAEQAIANHDKRQRIQAERYEYEKKRIYMDAKKAYWAAAPVE